MSPRSDPAATPNQDTGDPDSCHDKFPVIQLLTLSSPTLGHPNSSILVYSFKTAQWPEVGPRPPPLWKPLRKPPWKALFISLITNASIDNVPCKLLNLLFILAEIKAAGNIVESPMERK
jgi:hypothetical protein